MNRRNFLKALSGAVFIAVAPKVLADEQPRKGLELSWPSITNGHDIKVQTEDFRHHVGDEYMFVGIPHRIISKDINLGSDGMLSILLTMRPYSEAVYL